MFLETWIDLFLGTLVVFSAIAGPPLFALTLLAILIGHRIEAAKEREVVEKD